MEPKPRNERQNPVTKFCLAMEELRRTEAGRVKNSKELVEYFFPHDATKARDQLFVYLPREVRAPIVAGWGIRGAKAALRDDDDRIRTVIHDAILAGDIDDVVFEEGITPAILADWVPLDEWWTFWRSGKVSGVPAQKALATARELGLFDDKWFLENLEGRGGRLKGTDTIADTLSKEQIVAWVRGLHASGDGSPAGIVAALGWDVILTKTAQEALLFALDALAKKLGLVVAKEAVPRGSEVPGIAIPDFPMEEKGVTEPEEPVNVSDSLPVQADSLVPFPDSGGGWPEIAAPGDMGYALAQPGAIKTGAIKPSYGNDEEITSEHQIVKPGAVDAPK
ncbi:MAG: hypothetical protein JWP87_2709 [Labilithrix sp.]|nr:hypothetical protein [Labilithrix sp.]